MADELVARDGTKCWIGHDIPDLHIMTVELRYGRDDQKMHDEVYHKIIRSLKDGAAGDALADPTASIGREPCLFASFMTPRDAFGGFICQISS
jgi:hypothetical protein